MSIFKDVAARRSVTTFLWAQEDNSYYYGSPVPSVENLGSKLRDAKADGYGIINWNSRPLDLFYLSAASQVWKSTFDRTLKMSCEDYARHYFSEPEAAAIMGDYFDQWMKKGISVGRESGYRFDGIPHNPDSIRPSIQERRSLLDSASKVTGDTNAAEVIAYYRGLEIFCLTFNENERDYRQAMSFLNGGRMEEARKTAAKCNPEQDIEDFAAFCAHGGITRGEQGLLVSMNLRWLPYYVALRQALRMEPIRYNFNATVHEPMVHEPGWITLHFDQGKNVCHNYGLAETGAMPFKLSPGSVGSLSKELNEIASTGVASDKPFLVRIAPILGWGVVHQTSEANLLAPGNYRLDMFLAAPPENADAIFDIALTLNTPFKRFTFPNQKTKFLRILTGKSDAFNAIRLLDGDRYIPAERFATKPTVEQKEGETEKDYQTRIAAAKKATFWTNMTCTAQDDLSVNGLLINGKCTGSVIVQISDDGKNWQTITVSPATTETMILRERLDCKKQIQGRDVLKLSYPIAIPQDGTIDLQLTPVQGKAFINALILTPDAIAAAKATPPFEVGHQ